MSRPPRLFFDISYLLVYVRDIDSYSGIQRVVTKLLGELQNLPERERFFAAFRLNENSEELLTLPLTEIGPDILDDPLKMRSFFFNEPVRSEAEKLLARYRKRKFRYYYHRTRLDLAAILGRRRPFNRYQIAPSDWRKMRREKPKRAVSRIGDAKPITGMAAPDDILMLMDSTWREHDIRVFLKAKSSGMRIGTLVYDLIPILLPHVVHPLLARMFRAWLVESAEYTDFYMTISKSARDDLRAFFHGRGREVPVSVLALTQTGLDSLTDTDGAPDLSSLGGRAAAGQELDVKDGVRSVLNTPFALCVGTIEPRKNGWRLAMAWKYLVDQGHVDLPRLVFAGRRGWFVDEFFNAMQATGNVYGYVSIVDGPSDKELNLLYRHCEFALMPSLYEGWGLPVGEALSCGKTAVVGNGSSLPEVGQDLVEYCDATSIASIAEAVLTLHQNPGRRRDLEARIAAARLRSWKDVAEDMMRIMRD
jgi:glycosyltransferase involved in cell wall biosynthesis